MRSFIISVTLVALILVAVTANCVISEKTLGEFERVAEKASENDVGPVREYFAKVEIRLMLGVCDSELDKIDSTVAELESAKGSPNFERIKSRLVREITQLRRRLGCNSESII